MTAPPRDSSTVRVCPVRDIVCSTPNECDQRETGCMMLINLPPELDHLRAATAPSAEPPAQAATDDLVQRLRDYSPFERQHVVHEAADLIERQAREIAELRAARDGADARVQMMFHAKNEWRERAERAEALAALRLKWYAKACAERDALREQLHLRTCERDEAQACITTSADTIAALRECVKAADAMYALTEHTGGVSDCAKCNVADDYLAARAKVKP